MEALKDIDQTDIVKIFFSKILGKITMKEFVFNLHSWVISAENQFRDDIGPGSNSLLSSTSS